MATLQSKQDFFETPEGIRCREMLETMDASDRYITAPSYSPKTEVYGDNLIPFVDKHMNYIRTHPKLNPEHYLSNLQILTRVK